MSITSEQSFEYAEVDGPSVEAGYSIFEHKKKLIPNEATRIDCSKQDILGENSEFKNELTNLIGESLPVIAQIGLKKGADSFFILDTTESEKYSSPYIVLKEEIDANGRSKGVMKGIWQDRPTVIGKARRHENRFNHSPYVSSSHFSLEIDGDDIVATDLESTNGTYVTGFIRPTENIFQPSSRDNIEDKFTENFVERARRLADFDDRYNKLEAPYGTYKTYSIIGRNSPTVRGGVYGTSRTQSEYVVVDADSPHIKLVEESLVNQIHTWYGSHLKGQDVLNALHHVRDTTADKMKYDLARVEDLSRPYFNNQGLIMLSDYLDEGVGVCRHQALLAAVFTEGLIRDGILDGLVHVERNHDLEANGAHAWMVYEGKDETIIVDPAQNFVGTREKARQEGRWRYYVDASRQQ